MAKRKIRRRTGEGVSISGPATVRVMRGVTLVIEAAREAECSEDEATFDETLKKIAKPKLAPAKPKPPK